MDGKHTPTPWGIHEAKHADGEYWASIGYAGRGPITDIVGAEGNLAKFFQPVAGMKYLVTPVDEQRANATFIVRAVNHHEELVGALNGLLRMVPARGGAFDTGTAVDKAHAVLDKVEASNADVGR